MIDVSQFMPPLNEMILMGDALVKPSCWSAKLALESYAAGIYNEQKVLQMATESKESLDSVIGLSNADANYSTQTAYAVLDQIIAEFSNFTAP